MAERTSRRCAWCADRFTQRRCDQRTCSASCRRRHNLDEQNAKLKAHHQQRCCWTCGGVYLASRSDARYCSTRCYTTRQYRSSHYRFAVCVVCSAEYRRRADSKTCSTACRYQLTEWRRPGYRRIKAVLAPEDRSVVAARDWQRTLNRFGGRCCYCARPTKAQIEHVVPLARGGRHTIGNLLPACGDCNNRKSDRFLSVWRYKHGGYSAWPISTHVATMVGS